VISPIVPKQQRRIIVKSGTAVSREVAVFESGPLFPPVIGTGYSDNRDSMPQIDIETTKRRDGPCPLERKLVEAIFMGYATSARWRAMARWSSWSLPSAVVPGAILVNRPTLEGKYLLLGQAVAISRATGINAFVFSRMGYQQGEGYWICVARIEGSRPQWQKRCEDHEDADRVSPAVFHDLAPLDREYRGFDVPTAVRLLNIRRPATTREASPFSEG
jgi:hypothetical protein